jgi:hypothetical protein
MGKNMKKSRKHMWGGEPSDSGATDGESSSNSVAPAQGVPIESVTPPVGVPPAQGPPVAQGAPVAQGEGVWGKITGLFSSKEDFNAEIKKKQEEIAELRTKQAAEQKQAGGRRRSNKKRTRRTKRSRRSRRNR